MCFKILLCYKLNFGLLVTVYMCPPVRHGTKILEGFTFVLCMFARAQRIQVLTFHSIFPYVLKKPVIYAFNSCSLV